MTKRVPLEHLLRDLPEELKREVEDFAAYLLERRLREEDLEWNHFSLAQALAGAGEEVAYTEADLKERWA